MPQDDQHRLRAMEPGDADFLYALENIPHEWWVGAQVAPISKATLQLYIAGDHDLFRDQQIRFILEDERGKAVAAVDLYQLDARNQRAGVGIAVAQGERQKGHATAGLRLLLPYAFEHLGLRQLWAEIPSIHPESLKLFERNGFVVCGDFKDWIRTPTGWCDAVCVQAIRKE